MRAELAGVGAIAGRVTLTLVPARDGSTGSARIDLAGPTRAPDSRVTASIAGAPGDGVRATALFERASGGAATPARIAAGLDALRDEARSLGYAGAEATLDSVAVRGGDARVFVTVYAGPLVRVESLELLGAASTRPGSASTIAGLRRGALVTPAALASARERLLASDLFASVGLPEIAPGTASDKARVVVPVEELRSSRFEGALGLQNGGGVTGLLDLALGNIAGSGRSVGARWHGYGQGRSEYAARYREPALLGRPLDAALLLEGDLAESLYTRTRWEVRLGARPWTRARASLGVERSGTVYTGAASGTSETWSLTGAFGWEGLAPRSNPDHGLSASVTLSAGRRSEQDPGFATDRRGIARASFSGAAAFPTGGSRALVAALKLSRVALGGAGGFPAEELQFLGGSEGLRGHADRAFAGDRILAGALEHRWIGAGESRTYLFLDAAYHGLGAPLVAGAAPVPLPLVSGLGAGSAAGADGASPSSLARTQLSNGWEFGYGAGLRTRLASGAVGIELGFAPGASIREAKLHIHYASTW
jgi:outer membrane protein assembly factor BamA